MQTAIGLHEPALVPPQDFLDRMTQLWSNPPRNMPTSPALLDGWSVLVSHFHKATKSNQSEDQHKPSFVLPLPTASGKTEGTIVYAALQAKRNIGHPNPVGILIATRLREEAEALATRINTEAGHSAAVAHHTENEQSAETLAAHDVLVITQAKLLSAARAFKELRYDRWDSLNTWSGGKRSLIIVDEALSGVVDHHEVTSSVLDAVLRAIPLNVQQEHPEAIRNLSTLKGYLDKRAENHVSGDDQARVLWRGGSTVPGEHVRRLRDSVKTIEFPTELFNEDAARTVAGVLADVAEMLDSFAYYYRAGALHSINSSRYLLPAGMPGLVVLDATAGNNLMYELLEDSVYTVSVPPRIRDYSNVTLHVSRTASGLGKTKMMEKKHARLPRLAEELAKEIGSGRSVFLCVHKHAKDLAATFRTKKLPLHEKIGWWGAVDGKNTWQECDVAVIFGLPYMNPKIAINNVFAVTGPKDTTWLKSPVYREHVNVIDLMIIKDTAASVVQAINRVRCRRVVDANGGCQKTDVYVVLPSDWRGDEILETIRHSMPGIKEISWDFEPDGPKVYAPRAGSASGSIISLVRDMPPGSITLPAIKKELSLTDKQFKRIKDELAKPKSNLSLGLQGVGVFYNVERRGKYSTSYLTKAALPKTPTLSRTSVQ
jgi:hypothetical protein